MNQKQAERERERERGFRGGEWDVGVRLLLDNRGQDRVMDNFGCQQLGYPDIWSNSILVVSVRVILDEINT